MFETKSLYNPSGTAVYANGRFVMAGMAYGHSAPGMVFFLGGDESDPEIIVRAMGVEGLAEDWFQHEESGSSAVQADGSGFHSGRYSVETGECVRFARLLPSTLLDKWPGVSGPAMIYGTFHMDYDGNCSLVVNQGSDELEDIYEFSLFEDGWTANKM